jgi:hypothetical protein
LLGVEDLDTYKSFSGPNVQGDFFVQPHGATFLGALDQADVQGVYFAVIADAHDGLASEVKGGDYHDFGRLFLDDRGHLLDGIGAPLPGSAESDIISAQLTPLLGRFARPLPDRLDYFRFAGAAIQTLLASMFGQPNRLHSSPREPPGRAERSSVPLDRYPEWHA